MSVETMKLTGKPVVDFLRENIKERVTKLSIKDIVPKMLIIRVGAREDDVFYEKSILKNCSMLGIEGTVKELSADASMEELIGIIKEANVNDEVHGIMLFRPLPKHMDQEKISNIINPYKDVDCMSPLNMEKTFEGNSRGFAPCTPKAVVEMLRYYKIPMNGANIVVAGRSLVVGKPLSMLLLDENATVTICHSKTKDMKSVTKNADIVITAIGNAKFMNEDFFTEDSIVIDVGINEDGSGKICGDVDYDRTFGKVKALNPAAGGVGTITTTILLDQTVKACEMFVVK
ncbi:MAG: bifunctional 5,10-methylenetetrahydrofolate dehydrogenase/5,10-methenyltetrahydrofolate cyclohydrolase [Sedimentibacter sp.]|uniref:bifunctional 5,10-methylenetetrahydrofolate dehydrogenase/5,10-methenyltetrahydrofolate cyclohydrolase n=1 Tax=Sedimentibacter sp. TaxID=1960295 RepID=UPI002982A5C2|nr:bifunctional 5,10-methylenetetrahydrofolate dehydrogenase/5,10-methenyltetrahydrofolate cyclohydrolase [Sedimentibacter sp.]MDW5300195.1 bifunctional 5,10-methylenetetrahydrofolate dehydrogenase/5,10-methenyltetrahydrofolate cyclohydrolase [Sedimentibacter sp.]